MKNKRRHILDAALAVFAENGIGTSPVPSIAQMAGVATGTIYCYFASKNDLINQLYDEVERQLVGHIEEAAVFPSAETEQQITSIISRMLDFFLTNRDRFFFYTDFHNSASGAEYRKQRGKIPGDLGSLLSPVLQKGIDEGLVTDLPIDIHFKFCVDILFPLVRDHHLAVTTLDHSHLEQIPRMCLCAIRKQSASF